MLLTRSQWRVVKEFSNKSADHPAVASYPAAASPSGSAVLLTEADLEDSDLTQGIIKDANLSSHRHPIKTNDEDGVMFVV